MVFKTVKFSSELPDCEYDSLLELLQGKQFNYFGFKVLFDNEQVLLKKNIVYGVEAKITGPDSTCGDNGDGTVTCSGVTFTFYNKDDTGQFPEILFSL